MKYYIYTLIALITLGSILVGCASRGQQEQTVTTNNPLASTPSETGLKTSDSESVKAVTVYKSPTCGCCSKWEEHLTKAGFRVTSEPTNDMAAIRKRFGVPDKLMSCHTAVVDGFVIEGHVPAADVKKLLETRPAGIVGLTAPGMPSKSPGMQAEGEMPSGYDVLSFDREGNSKVFASYK